MEQVLQAQAKVLQAQAKAQDCDSESECCLCTKPFILLVNFVDSPIGLSCMSAERCDVPLSLLRSLSLTCLSLRLEPSFSVLSVELLGHTEQEKSKSTRCIMCIHHGQAVEE
jgi:hypothetical protein